MRHLHLATAGWAIPRSVADHFPAAGSGLARYASRFNAVEINSTFYRPHRGSTYARWAATTPEPFRFAVKVPKAITHGARLVKSEAPLAAFVSDVGRLGPKLGPLLVQLPPSLAFNAAIAKPFLRNLRDLAPDLPVALEPRHSSWFTAEADDLLSDHRVARIAADPARHAGAGRPGGWPGFTYHRLHGSPRMYSSSYRPEALHALARELCGAPSGSWCVFDNTALGAAAANALDLEAEMIAQLRPRQFRADPA